MAFPDAAADERECGGDAIRWRAGAAAVQYSGSGGRVMNWGFPFETITSASVRDAYMSDVLRFFGMIGAPQLLPLQTDTNSGNVTLNWSTSSGLKYRVQYKTNLNDTVWQTLGADVLATNTASSATDAGAGSVSQRFYRILLVN